MREVGKKEKRDTERCEERRTERRRERERENEGRSRKLRRHNKRDKGGRIGAIEEKRRTIGSDAGW
mgnify:CR=1 FL=1